MTGAIADFFINLGIRGQEKTVQGISAVKQGLEDTKSMSLATKAAIVGTVFALERLTNAAGERGMAFKQFAEFTGLSANMLQRWQVMARQSGVSAEEVTGSIKGVQSAMSDMLLGKGAPEGMGMLASITGGFDASRARDTFYVMNKLREFAQKTASTPDVANKVLQSFGLSEGTIQMLRTSKVELDKIKPNLLLSDSEFKRLADVQVMWANFWANMKMVTDRLTIQHGSDVIGFLKQTSDTILTLVTNLSKLTREVPIIKDALVAAGLAIFAAWSPLTATVGLLAYLMNEFEKDRQGKDSVFGVKKGSLKESAVDALSDVGAWAINSFRSGTAAAESFLKPKVSTAAGGGGQTNNITTTVHNHGVKDASEASHLFKKEIQSTFNQMGAKKGGQ